MKVTFLGATHEVTGSMTLLEVGGERLLIDCGMEQGKDLFVTQSIPVSPAKIGAVLLTHAHIDHSGNLPLLYKNGFRGKVYATDATCNLCDIMLRDSAGIQEFEAEWQNRKGRRAGEPEVEPIYSMADVEGLLKHLRPCRYGEKLRISEHFEIRFTNAGHLIGASSIEIWLTEDGVTRSIAFSGDVGNLSRPFLRDPEPIEGADFVVIESTYGDREHEKRGTDYVSALAAHLQRTFDRGGNVVIPTFAVGRAQEVLYYIREIKSRGLVSGHADFPVYLDSPLAEAATSVLLQTNPATLGDDMRALIEAGVNPIWFSNLNISQTADESKAINLDPTPKVILSASGMCEAGRIRHHLKHNLWRPECLVLFAGFQTPGTLGRALLDGAKRARLFGEDITVKCEIAALVDTSGHADRPGLVNWLKGMKRRPELIFVIHGDDDACTAFTEHLIDEHNYEAVAPYSGTAYDLITGEPEIVTQGVRVGAKPPRKADRALQAHRKLMAAAARLSDVAQDAKGMANKELAKFEGQILSLIDKWRR
ncbi:MAG: MBL fold metallo-hydrolase RNA specificity domain-containing protein [Christensenellales bacterium]|jgi:metallo-beta-lactamase family protein